MAYIDGFVAPVPLANRSAYLAFATKAAAVFKDHGALKVVECWGDDVQDGEVTSFPMAVGLQEEEAVVFSWIVWPDKAARDAGMPKVMADSRLQGFDKEMPFDGKRMIFGGFEVLMDL